MGYLTTTYNQSLILTYNFAVSGATLDQALVPSFSSSVVSMREQIQNIYLPTYASKPAFAPWLDTDSLFAFFIGINDVGNSYDRDEPQINALVFEDYKNLVDQVYMSGARNFMFLMVPPVERAPLTAQGAVGPAQGLVQQELAAVTDWNGRLINMVSNLTSTYSDATAFVFDTNGLFNNVLDKVGAYQQTIMLKDTTSFCSAYSA